MKIALPLYACALAMIVATAANAAPAPSASPSPAATPSMTYGTAPPAPPFSSMSPHPGASSAPQSLSLTDAENIALAQSPLITIARAQLDAAGGATGLAHSGGYPNISVSADSTRTKASSGLSQGTGATPAPSVGQLTSNSANANVRQLIFDGGRLRSQIVSATLNEDAARYTLARTVQSLFFTIAQDYYAALQARHALIAANDQLNLASVQYNLVNAQFKAGIASKADVLTALFPVAQARLKVAQQRNGEQLALTTLLNTMGLPATPTVNLIDDTSTAGGPILSTDQAMAVASVTRPDLLAAEASAKSADAAVNAAALARFPQLSATASDGVSGTAPGFGRNGNSYSYGLGLTFPLFDGGAIHAQTVSARAQADIAHANLKTAVLGVGLSVQQAILNLETASESVTAANAELANARTVLDVTNAQYKSGVTTLPLLLNAQVGLTTAESDQITALYNFKVAQAALQLAEGTISKP
ncbi:MAG TPA: TolC family protein [Candidatus Eremiobacteraceae bacterium]|nr:TolC family protein [Candidatus Eremiobacteraceae bacterium]